MRLDAGHRRHAHFRQRRLAEKPHGSDRCRRLRQGGVEKHRAGLRAVDADPRRIPVRDDGRRIRDLLECQDR